MEKEIRKIVAEIGINVATKKNVCKMFCKVHGFDTVPLKLKKEISAVLESIVDELVSNPLSGIVNQDSDYGTEQPDCQNEMDHVDSGKENEWDHGLEDQNALNCDDKQNNSDASESCLNDESKQERSNEDVDTLSVFPVRNSKLAIKENARTAQSPQSKVKKGNKFKRLTSKDAMITLLESDHNVDASSEAGGISSPCSTPRKSVKRRKPIEDSPPVRQKHFKKRKRVLQDLSDSESCSDTQERQKDKSEVVFSSGVIRGDESEMDKELNLEKMSENSDSSSLNWFNSLGKEKSFRKDSVAVESELTKTKAEIIAGKTHCFVKLKDIARQTNSNCKEISLKHKKHIKNKSRLSRQVLIDSSSSSQESDSSTDEELVVRPTKAKDKKIKSLTVKRSSSSPESGSPKDKKEAVVRPARGRKSFKDSYLSPQDSDPDTDTVEEVTNSNDKESKSLTENYCQDSDSTTDKEVQSKLKALEESPKLEKHVKKKRKPFTVKDSSSSSQDSDSSIVTVKEVVEPGIKSKYKALEESPRHEQQVKMKRKPLIVRDSSLSSEDSDTPTDMGEEVVRPIKSKHKPVEDIQPGFEIGLEKERKSLRDSSMSSENSDSDLGAADQVKESTTSNGKRKSLPFSKSSSKNTGVKNRRSPIESHSKELKKLRAISRTIGLILRNTIELKGCETDAEKVQRIKTVLREKGMKGRPSMKSAQQFNLERELRELGMANNSDSPIAGKATRKRSCRGDMSPVKIPVQSESAHRDDFLRIRDICFSDDASD